MLWYVHHPRLLSYIFIVMMMMDQACENGDFLDGPFSKEHMLNQQPLTWHEQMLIECVEGIK